jgi:hypothetical protein
VTSISNFLASRIRLCQAAAQPDLGGYGGPRASRGVSARWWRAALTGKYPPCLHDYN